MNVQRDFLGPPHSNHKSSDMQVKRKAVENSNGSDDRTCTSNGHKLSDLVLSAGVKMKSSVERL